MHSVVYISPRTLERFFDGRVPGNVEQALVDVGVTITKQGQEVAVDQLEEPLRELVAAVSADSRLCSQQERDALCTARVGLLRSNQAPSLGAVRQSSRS